MRFFRWRAIVPLALLLVAIAAGWVFFLDSAVRKGIEAVGTELVGAKVDLSEADVRLGEGSVVLRGLQVTNPDAPMTNLIQVDEIVADLRVNPLLQKKVFIDTIAARGVRFGTPRETSGALDDPDPQGGLLRRRISEWAAAVPVPDFSLQGLTRTVNVDAIRPENLRTPALARSIRETADSAQQAWMARLQALNPAPVIDSARALADRLQGATLASLGLTGVVRSVQSMRSTLDELSGVRDGIQDLAQQVSSGAQSLRSSLDGLTAARAEDLASARNLLNIPSLDAPDISPALFGDVALQRIQPVLYWAQMVERYLPPGLDPRRRPGPSRARLAGASVAFPQERGYAELTIGFAELGLRLEGEGAAAGEYRLVVKDLSSAPSVHGRPVRIEASRSGAATGPDLVQVSATLDHVTPAIRDSVNVRLGGLSLPSLTLPGVGVRLDLGRGANELVLARTADSVTGSWRWNSSQVTWDRGSLGPGRVNDILWRTLSALNDVEVEVRVSGNLSGPRLAIRSNIASAISRSLRQELANEVAAAEQRVRAEVERLVAQPVADARARVQEVEAQVQGLVAQHQERLEEVRAQLEAKLRELGR